MSIFVVTTQAFSITSNPVVVDWQYNPWGDSQLSITTDSEVYTQVSPNYVTFSFQLEIASGTETAVVRVELVDSSGDRVQDADNYSNGDPDDDAQWLVAAEQTTDAIGTSTPWTSGDFTFNDGNVDSTISGGGYFVVYVSSTGSTMSSLDMTPVDRTPVLAVDADTQTIRPTSYTETSDAWTNPTNAYDTTPSTVASQTSGDIRDAITFLPWATAGAGTGTINQVDISIEMQVAGFATSRNIDTLTVEVFVSGTTTGDSTVISADFNSIITFTDVTEPGDASWSWTDITNIEVRLTGAKVGGSDAISTWEITDVSGTVNP